MITKTFNTKLKYYFFILIVVLNPHLVILNQNLEFEIIPYEDVINTFILSSIIFLLIIFFSYFLNFKKNELIIISSLIFFFCFQFRLINLFYINFLGKFFIDRNFLFSLIIWLLIVSFIILLFNKISFKKFKKIIFSFFLILFCFNFINFLLIHYKSGIFKNESDIYDSSIKIENISLADDDNIYLIISDMFTSEEYFYNLYNDRSSKLSYFFEKKFFN